MAVPRFLPFFIGCGTVSVRGLGAVAFLEAPVIPFHTASVWNEVDPKFAFTSKIDQGR
jgi:hypothetical protein